MPPWFLGWHTVSSNADITFTLASITMIRKPQHIYAWLFCGFAALGACVLGYDGVYFNGVSSLVSFKSPNASETTHLQLSGHLCQTLWN